MEDISHTPGYPVGKRLSAKYNGTFGAVTLKERLPKILTQIIDVLHRYQSTLRESHGEDGTKAVKSVLALLAELRHHMQTDKAMAPILIGPDVEQWERVFAVYREKLGCEPHWFRVSWLFFECYMYRKVMEIIRNEPLLANYDPFRAQKEESFSTSMEQIKTVASKLNTYIEQPVLDRASFDQYLMLSLWGNKADLSMAATMDSYEMSHQDESVLHQYILSDDSQQVWDVLTTQKNSEKRGIAIVLDNSGFELFSDLVLAEWLLVTGLSDSVTLYCKQIPWFISDATRCDINWTLNQLSTSSDIALAKLGKRWMQRIADGSFKIVEHFFWTTCYEYSSMNDVAPDLYAALSLAKLVIFKGDLNYRKLLSDRNWPYLDSFSSALQGFRPTNVVALRTMKADLVVGLPRGAAGRAAAETADWMIKGLFAVMQVALI